MKRYTVPCTLSPQRDAQWKPFLDALVARGCKLSFVNERHFTVESTHTEKELDEIVRVLLDKHAPQRWVLVGRHLPI